MKERPILFSAPMVRAILDGSKTQTRRVSGLDVINVEPDRFKFLEIVSGPGVPHAAFHDERTGAQVLVRVPYGQPDDRLWVKETWTPLENVRTSNPGLDAIQRGLYYRADYPGDTLVHDDRPDELVKWKSSLFMRRNQSRILLEVTGVRIERLNDCSEADAIAEGITKFDSGWLNYDGMYPVPLTAIESYRSLWEQINGVGGWEANPWVWVVEFKRVSATNAATQ